MSNTTSGTVPAMTEGRPQNLVLTLFGTYVHPRDETVWSGGLVTILGEFGFSQGASRVALARMVKGDLLERVRSGRFVSYRATARTTRLLDEGDKRIFSLGQAPRSASSWTVLWHVIPEERRLERTRLGRRLRFLGFGTMQDGIWISPHDREDVVTPILRELELDQFVGVVVGKPASGLDFRNVARRIWDLDALGLAYERFLADFQPYTKRKASSTLTPREAFLIRTRAVHEWRHFPAYDPDLPDELMPEPKPRARAVAVFQQLFESLRPAAESHFAEVTNR
jgi:phenylacetic acid degradation operon negative regulatory protein